MSPLAFLSVYLSLFDVSLVSIWFASALYNVFCYTNNLQMPLYVPWLPSQVNDWPCSKTGKH